MRKYNRHKSERLTKKLEESIHNYEYYFYSLWYDDAWDDDIYTLTEEGLDWYDSIKEIIERNDTINDVLGIDNDNSDLMGFNPLNF